MECLCYPYGDFDRKVMQEAEKCGYKLGLAIFYDVPLWTQDLLALPPHSDSCQAADVGI